MKSLKVLLCFLCIASLFGGLVIVGAQQSDLDRELEEAKTLYREAKFAQAIAKLQSAIGRLEQLRDLEARKMQLADAYLHLALSYVALNDPTAAEETLKQMVRLDRARRLDPEVYAPKVIELFEQARAEVAAEPVPTAQTPAGPAPTGAEPKKKGSRLPYMLIGAGGAAAGGIAAAGGGASTTTPSPAPAATTTTTTSVPTSSGPEDIVLIGVDPPPGSSISLSRETLWVTVSVVYSRSGAYGLFAGIDPRGYQGGGSCVWGGSDPFHLTPAEARTVSFRMTQNPNEAATPACRPPFSTNVLTVDLNFDPHIGRPALRREFNVAYTFVP